MKRSHVRSRGVREALDVLGTRIAAGRRTRGWTAAEFAERLGVSPATARSVERGEPTVAIGTVFEAALLTGVTLFDPDPDRVTEMRLRGRAELALLPARVRPESKVDSDF